MKEIEYKFLVTTDPRVAVEKDADEVLDVQQGYVLATEPMELRVRVSHWYRPIPSFGKTEWHLALKFGNGFIRREYETAVPAWLGRLAMRFAGKPLFKRRINTGGWSLDIFRGLFAGLVLAECELPHADAAPPALPFGVLCVADVTESGDFANKRLARMGGNARDGMLQDVAMAAEHVRAIARHAPKSGLDFTFLRRSAR